MFHNNAAIRQVLRVFAGVVICTAAMFGVYAIIGRFSKAVLLGGIFGTVVSVLNFLFLSMTVSNAADKAETTGEAAKAKLSVQASSVIRMLVLAVVYIIVLKSGFCDPVASVLPLVFVQLSITVIEYFRKDGADK